MGTDIHQAREHAPAYAKGEVGAETGLDFAGQRHGSLSVPRLHISVCTNAARSTAAAVRSLQALKGVARSASASAALMGFGRTGAGGAGAKMCMTHSRLELELWLCGKRVCLLGCGRHQLGRDCFWSTTGSGAAGRDRAIGALLAIGQGKVERKPVPRRAGGTVDAAA